jgi:hypothetical protein
MLKPFLVTDHFDGHRHASFVVETLEGLAETTRAKFVQDFKTISQMIFQNNLVVATLVVKAKVVP